MRWPRGSCFRLQAIPVALAGSLVPNPPAWFAFGPGLRLPAVRWILHAMKSLTTELSGRDSSPKVGGPVDRFQMVGINAVANSTQMVQVEGSGIFAVMEVEPSMGELGSTNGSAELSVPVAKLRTRPQPASLRIGNVPVPVVGQGAACGSPSPHSLIVLFTHALLQTSRGAFVILNGTSVHRRTVPQGVI